MGLCLASCLYTCDCCISPCCYGCLMHGCCGKHDGDDGDNMFNSALGLVIYNKWVKSESPAYLHRKALFDHVLGFTDGGKILSREATDHSIKKVDNDLVVLDIGCGTGVFTEILCHTFLTTPDDTLICMDISPLCLQFVRDRVVDSNKQLRNLNIDYFCNESHSLALGSNHSDNKIDVILMAFVLHHISPENGDRENILKEAYKACKVGGTFTVIELGPDFLKGDDHHHGHGHHGAKVHEHEEQQPLKESHGHMHGFENCDALQRCVESVGFRFADRICTDMLGVNTQWALVFRKE
eukprot:1045854_1